MLLHLIAQLPDIPVTEKMGAVPIMALVLYALVREVLVPLLKKKPWASANSRPAYLMEFQSRLSTIEQRLTAIEARATADESRVTADEVRDNAGEKRHSAMESRTTIAEGRTTAIEIKGSGIDATLSSILNAIEDLRSDVKALTRPGRGKS